MKKLLTAILFLMMAIQISVLAQEPLIKDDFDKYEVGTDYITTDSPYKFGTSVGAVMIGNDNDGRGNYLEIDSAYITENSGYTNKDTSKPKGIVTYSFDYIREYGYTNGAHFYVYSNRGTALSLQLNNSPVYYDGKSQSVYMNGTIPSGRWVNITAVVNTDTDTFDVYVDGYKITNAEPFRGGPADYISKADIFNNGVSTRFKVRNVRTYQGEVLPELTEYAKELYSKPEAELINYSDGLTTVAESIPDSCAVFAGYSVAYNRGGYGLVEKSNKKLAPIMDNGYIYVPAGYAATMFGGTYDRFSGKITSGSKSAVFEAGKITDLSPVAPELIGGSLYIPLCNRLAEFFGTTLFTDERGLAITGISVSPGEGVIKPLINELRCRSSIFGLGVYSEVLYSSRNFRGASETVWGTIDAAKRFMATSNRWTYTNEGRSREAMEDLGTGVQSTVNAVPSTPETDADGKTVTYEYNGSKYTVWKSSAYNVEGNLYIRSDGLGNWGCVNNPYYFDDILGEIKDGIDLGQYVWQFDDYSLNANYNGGCFCDYCMADFPKWLVKNGYTSENLYTSTRITEAEKKWIEDNGGVEAFNLKKYYNECRDVRTYEEYCAKKSSVKMQVLYQTYCSDIVFEWQKRLRAEIDKYAEEKGVDFYMAGNSSDHPQAFKNDARMKMYDILDGAMGETSPKNFTADAIFGSAAAEQAYGISYINSPWIRQGRTTIQNFIPAVALSYATGQNTLVPWDDWVYNTTRYYANLKELEGVYSFVREYPWLFDNYDTVQEVGYIYDLDQSDGLSEADIRKHALALAKKGVASKAIGKRSNGLPYLDVDVEDFAGVKNYVNVNDVSISRAERNSAEIIGDNILEANKFDGSFETDTEYADGSSGSCTYEFVEDEGNAYEGKRYVSIKSPKACVSLRFNHLNKNVEVFKSYEVSYYVKAKDGTTGTASVMISNATPATNGYYPIPVDSNSVTLSDKWQKVSTTVAIYPHFPDDPTKLAYAQAAYDKAIADGKTEAEAKAAYDAVLDESNWNTLGGFHVGVNAPAGEILVDKFEVREIQNILMANGYDGQFDADTVYTSSDGSSNKIESKAVTAKTSSSCIALTNDTSSTVSALRFNFLTNGIEIGKTYEISFWARSESDSNTISPMVSNSTPASNTLYPINSSAKNVGIDNKGWKKITATFTVGAHTPEDNAKQSAAKAAYDSAIAAGKSVAEAEVAKAKVLNPANWRNIGIHVGVNVRYKGTVYVDNFLLREIPTPYTYDSKSLLTYNEAEKELWTARIKDMPDDVYAVLRKHTLKEDAPVVVHAVNFHSVTRETTEIEINNRYLPGGNTFTVKVYAPQKNPVVKTVYRNAGGITTITVDDLDTWAIVEISGDNTQSIARFNVKGLSGIGIGSRVSYDSAEGTRDSFVITSYGEGLNRYTLADGAGQDEVGYVYERILADDVMLSAQLQPQGGYCGLMLREDVYSNAPMIAVVYDGENGLRIAKRGQADKAVYYETVGETLPAYLKLKNENSVVTVYASDNGTDWTDIHSSDIYFKPSTGGAFATGIDGGMAKCAVNGFELVQTEFEYEYDINSENLFGSRNPHFTLGAVTDYINGYDGIYGTKPTAKVEVMRDAVDGDLKSVKLTGRSAGNESPVYKYLPIENGNIYEASVWVKTDSGATETGRIIAELPASGEVYNGVTYAGTATVEILENSEVSFGEEWKRMFVRFKVSETGKTHGINIRFETSGNSDVYVDSFDLRQLHCIGDKLYGTLTEYQGKTIFDIAASTDEAVAVKLMSVVKYKDENGVNRIRTCEFDDMEITEETVSRSIDARSTNATIEIYLWEKDNLNPIMRTFKVK